jgi:homeobox protein cut-like
MELEKSRNLAATLENDLEKVQNEAVNAFPSNASVAGIHTSRYPHSSLRRGRAASPTSSIISGFDPQSDSPARSSETTVYGGGSGMLPMITAQRDRYKNKNADLELQLQKSHSTIQSLRSEISSLQKDNLNLYEKTRYVSTYARGSHATASSASAYSATAPAHTAIAIDDGVESSGGGLDQRYRPAYEANISPFAAFRSRESSRAFRRMALPERVVFQITKMVLATRTSRNLFAMYCLALHLLVLGMLYYLGSTTTAGKIVTASVGAANAASGFGNAGSVSGQVGGGAAGGPKVAAEWHREGFQEGG